MKPYKQYKENPGEEEKFRPNIKKMQANAIDKIKSKKASPFLIN